MDKKAALSGLYRHFEGGLYKALGYTQHPETEELMVVYHAVGDPSMALLCCLANTWFETVDVNGRAVPRFRPIDGAHLIAQERERQCNVEGYTADHDAEHNNYEFIKAAILYIANAVPPNKFGIDCEWPFDPPSDKRKKHGTVKSLTIAGALLAAEIDRRLRMGETP